MFVLKYFVAASENFLVISGSFVASFPINLQYVAMSFFFFKEACQWSSDFQTGGSTLPCSNVE